MDFDELLSQVLALLQRDQRISYRALQRRFGESTSRRVEGYVRFVGFGAVWDSVFGRVMVPWM